MSWNIEYNDDLQIVVCTYLGKCTGQDLRDASTKRIALAQEVGSSKTLIEASKLETEGSTTFDVYNIIRKMYQELGSRADWRIAIVTPETTKAAEQVHFYVTACQNRGWVVEEFPNKEDAIDWLIKNSPSTAGRVPQTSS